MIPLRLMMVSMAILNEDWLSSIFKHSFFEGGLQGGNVFHGMLVGAVSSSGSKFMNDHARSLGVNEYRM